MADTIKRAVDIEVTIRHADSAKRDLRDVAAGTDKAAGSAQKLLKELLKMSGGLKSLGAAAADTGAQITSLESVEGLATWFKKATKEVNGFEAATAKTGTTARKTSGDFAKMEAELQRLGDVTEGGVRISRLLVELRDSAEWLVPAIKKARAAGYEFTGVLYQMANLTERYAKAALGTKDALKELRRETRNLKDTTKDLHKTTQQETYDISEFDEVVKGVGKETKKTGGMFDFAKGKLLKFAGAIGFGVYSMYSLAAALRRGLRAVVDFVKDGIAMAIEKNQKLAHVIKSEVIGRVDDLKLKLGNELLPEVAALSVEIGKLLSLMQETGVIEAFGEALSVLAKGIIIPARGIAKTAGWLASRKGVAVPLAGVQRTLEWLGGDEEAEGDEGYQKYMPAFKALKGWDYEKEKEKKPAGVGYAPTIPEPEPEAPQVGERRQVVGFGERPEPWEKGVGYAAQPEDKAWAERRKKEKAKEKAEELAEMKKQAEKIGRLMDPTSFLIEGLKSKDMGKAAKDAGIMLGETMARELMRKLIISGIMQILTLATGGATAPLQMAIGQRGMYTGEHEGPVWVHPHEVIAPLDTISQMSKLINTAMVGGAPAAAAAPAPGGVNVMVAERAGDLVDVYRTESITRGGEALSALEGA